LRITSRTKFNMKWEERFVLKIRSVQTYQLKSQVYGADNSHGSCTAVDGKYGADNSHGSCKVVDDTYEADNRHGSCKVVDVKCHCCRPGPESPEEGPSEEKKGLTFQNSSARGGAGSRATQAEVR
jgi:hypothetical protein